MATIQQITQAADALEAADRLISSLQARKNAIQGELDSLQPQLVSARQQARAARDNLVTLINQGIEI